MATATCRGCGADITWLTVDGERTAFDVHEVTAGPGRYTQTEEGLKPVTESASISALQLHEQTCSLTRA